jgi:threonine/homoserine/homoserine lactone efflux protein
VVVTLIVATLRRFLTTRVRRVLDATVGTVLIGLGIRIATT